MLLMVPKGHRGRMLYTLLCLLHGKKDTAESADYVLTKISKSLQLRNSQMTEPI